MRPARLAVLPSPATVTALVDAGAARARAGGQRWTPQRGLVYTALLQAQGPLGAYELITRLTQRHNLPLKPASLYRTLDDLAALGLVVKIESLNAWRACHHPHDDHQHVFLVCDGCGQTDEIADDGIARQLSSNAAALGFHTRRQVLELRGQCRDCNQ